MNEKQFATYACVGAILALLCLVYLGTQSTGAVINYNNPHRQSEYVSYDEVICGEGEFPITVQETRYGSGKRVVVGCAEDGSVVSSSGVPFPPIRQRYRQPRLRYHYY